MLNWITSAIRDEQHQSLLNAPPLNSYQCAIVLAIRNRARLSILLLPQYLPYMQKQLTRTNEEILALFRNLQTREDIASLLEVNDSTLKRYLYWKVNSNYREVSIPKKRGGNRTLCIPISPIKILQQKLNFILSLTTQPHSQAHGFTKYKSIVTNARPHVGRPYVLNIDLQDFFPSIHFGRVRGLFLSKRFNFNSHVATVLAQICCHDGKLPQGAPTSPIISNLVCYRLDKQLYALGKKYNCYYSRYADDITFSSNQLLPNDFVKYVVGTNRAEAGLEIQDVINRNDFTINADKVRFYSRSTRQVITGLTVNQKLNVSREFIRDLRVLLHSWTKYGLDNASKVYFDKLEERHKSKFKANSNFEQIVAGKIEFLGMVRGKDDGLYRYYYNKLVSLMPEIGDPIFEVLDENSPITQVIIACEGKTDYIHLEKAFSYLQENNEYLDLKLDFNTYRNSINGSKELLSTIKGLCKAKNNIPIIGIFDRDELNVLREAGGIDQNKYYNYNNNVFVFALPIPDHRADLFAEDLSIEMYYTDQEIKDTKVEGRLLYFSDEFDQELQILKTDSNIIASNEHTSKIKNQRRKSILDSGIYDRDKKSIALSKNDFANEVSRNSNRYDFLKFRPIFEIIKLILSS